VSKWVSPPNPSSSSPYLEPSAFEGIRVHGMSWLPPVLVWLIRSLVETTNLVTPTPVSGPIHLWLHLIVTLAHCQLIRSTAILHDLASCKVVRLMQGGGGGETKTRSMNHSIYRIKQNAQKKNKPILLLQR